MGIEELFIKVKNKALIRGHLSILLEYCSLVSYSVLFKNFHNSSMTRFAVAIFSYCINRPDQNNLTLP